MTSEAPERWYVSGNEYAAMQGVFGMTSVWSDECAGRLKKRAQAAGVWDEMQEIERLSDIVLRGVLRTVPLKKLAHIQQEMSNARVYIRIEAPGIRTVKNEQYCYVDSKTLNDLLSTVIAARCVACDQTAKEARKCPYRIMIEKALPNEVDQKDSEYCKFSDMAL